MNPLPFCKRLRRDRVVARGSGDLLINAVGARLDVVIEDLSTRQGKTAADTMYVERHLAHAVEATPGWQLTRNAM